MATILARICCHNNTLPQGAPTSPTISNMICARMDAELQQLAKRTKCTYTRYADDITFSSNRPSLPATLVTLNEHGQPEIGHDLDAIITNNGFQINERKIRLTRPTHRQEVTGLTTNVFPNVPRKFIRQIRGMLNAAEKYGLDAAQAKFDSDYSHGHLAPYRQKKTFAKIVKGKIDFLGMVRGKGNPMYLRFQKRMRELTPELFPDAPEESTLVDLPTPLIVTEGKTDWKHIKTALSKLKLAGLYPGLEVEFQEFGDETKMGSGELKKLCAAHAKVRQNKPIICIFDRDEPQIVKEVSEPDRPFKWWGNNVYSFVIPIPEHRVNAKAACIELYYQDKDIKRSDENGRRLFLNSEFKRKTGRHTSLSDILCGDRNKYQSDDLQIVDSMVWNIQEDNIALSKSDFADLVAEGIQRFADVDFTAFRAIFAVITAILQHANAQQPANDR